MRQKSKYIDYGSYNEEMKVVLMGYLKMFAKFRAGAIVFIRGTVFFLIYLTKLFFLESFFLLG